MPRKSINILLLFLAIFFVAFTTSCDKGNKLLLLNWGEYINMDVVEAFEKEYNCEVVISLADSNDLFYSKVKSGTTVYDLVVPSDYMVEKMYQKNMLQPIDYTRLGFNDYPSYLNTFLPGVQGIISEMENDYPGVKDYFVPYFWGTWGIMYNKQKEGLQDAIAKATEEGNVWKVMFEDSAVPAGTRVGMYETSRYAYAATMFYKGLSPNLNSDEGLKIAKDVLNKKKFTSWATDTLKKDISHNNLDLGFMWTGDFLDMFYEQLKVTSLDKVNFDIIIPEDTVAFCDNFVLTKNARHVDLAYDFIKFFLDSENAYQNASIIGYCTPIEGAYDKITQYDHTIDSYNKVKALLEENKLVSLQASPTSQKKTSYILEGTFKADMKNSFILEITNDELQELQASAKAMLEVSEEISDLDPSWLSNWSYAVSTYYPILTDSEKGFKGQVLSDLPREYIDQINVICNNARV